MAIDASQTRSGWSIKVQIARVLWGCLRPLFWSFWGRNLSSMRVAALRLFGARIGTPNLVCGGVRIWMPWNLIVGNGASIGQDVEIYNFARVTIGDNATISQYTLVCAASHDYTIPTMPLIMAPIVIGTDTWICARSFIGPGVTIGEGAVVGACAVVVKNIPPWSVCGGNPCIVIKARVMKA